MSDRSRVGLIGCDNRIVRTLGDRVASVDAAHFVNRAAELRRLEAVLDGERRIALVHGPGGVGKSALLREFARRAEARGWTAWWIEGRELRPDPGALEDLLSNLRHAERPLLLIDTYERMEALAGHLRTSFLPALPEQASVLIAGRRVPGPEWHEHGWEELTLELRIDGLSDADALKVVSHHHVGSDAVAREIVRWAEGSPLALTLAAQVAGDAQEWDGGPAGRDMVRAIVSRLADPEFEPQHAQTLWVGATARVTTLELLQDVLPDADAAAELRWLATRSFAEPLGNGVALHELVAKALHQELTERDPLRERELRRRICEHLYTRARGGDHLLTIDLSHLSQTPAIRWGFAWQPATRFRLADLRPGDAEHIYRRLSGTWYEQLLPGTALFLEQAPEHVTTVRDSEDRLRGYTIALTPPDAPAFCASDPLLGPRLEHAQRLADPAQAILWRDAVDLAPETDPAVIAMIGMAGMLRSAHGNPRYAYLPINPKLPGALEFSHALNGQRVEGLDAKSGKATIECHIIDYGPGGLHRAQRDLIYRELGLTPPVESVPQTDLNAVVRDALRNVHRPQALAASELAQGGTLEERASSVTALIEEAAERAFADTPGDQLTRQALILGYLERAPSHELAAKQLSLSRAAYFRRLRRGIDQLATYIDAKRSQPGTPA